MDETEIHKLLDELIKHLDRIEELAQVIGDYGDQETQKTILRGLQIIDRSVVKYY